MGIFDIDEDIVQDKTYTKISFNYTRYEDGKHHVEASANRNLRNDQAEYLPHILDAFREFLNASGYTYVREVYVVKESGEENSSSEVLY